MRISILTPTYNAAQTISYCLDSFCEQSWSDKELILLDGESDDCTVEIAETYKNDGVKIFSKADKGMYYALNSGLVLFSGDAVGVLNSDDAFADKIALEVIADGLTTADIVYGGINFISDHMSKRVVRKWRSSTMPEAGFKYGWMPPHPSFYVRREVADTVGQFDVKYRVAADYDWMMRCCHSSKFVHGLVDFPLVNMQIGGASTKSYRNIISHNSEALLARRKNLGVGLIDLAYFLKPARKINQYWSN